MAEEVKFNLQDITVVICNWMQTRFTLGAVRNIRHFYPEIKIIVVDDGSTEKQHTHNDFNRAYGRSAYCKKERFDLDMDTLISQVKVLCFELVIIPKHVGHGSALDYGIEKVKTILALAMDNDIRLTRGGLVDEYLEKMNSDNQNIYAVGTGRKETFEPASGIWIDPWFSLYQVAPIKELHLTFSSFVFPRKNGPSFHLGTGGFLHTMLTYTTLHRPKIWKAIYYPEPECIKCLWHLKKFPYDKPGNQRYDMWKEYIDGGFNQRRVNGYTTTG